jgi:hypothetical protein
VLVFIRRGVHRPDIEDLVVMRIVEFAIGEGKTILYDKKMPPQIIGFMVITPAAKPTVSLGTN